MVRCSSRLRPHGSTQHLAQYLAQFNHLRWIDFECNAQLTMINVDFDALAITRWRVNMTVDTRFNSNRYESWCGD